MQQKILDIVKDTSHYVTFLDSFSLTGMHGAHLVLVLPVRGPSLHPYLRSVGIKTRMRAAKQLLLALKSLHDADFVYCGE